ncbi:hypothetical protein CCR94_20805 [Rhodoblastus sphagnicola]|uniref:Hedgehog/Intein (Hint) domain-containing protein n=1 Tax=Rhodoblastus sphagnicola TaxID=333368 RepID=A0A2S6MXP1_9HYPH|nr:Ig-like domain-containing protein [Rhodoblastus sphagnicola]MBB4196765.1 hypothetical protein [Rhodoblastus sphagnicola]PPQ27118.1 hypothetical protein CCR94_20805 [Rhodoblastus sphagnicola]
MAATISDSAVVNNYVNAVHNKASQKLTGTGAPAGATIAVEVTIVYPNGITTTSSYGTKADGSGGWSVKIGALNNGFYTYTATATDADGIESEAGALSFTVDKTAPGAPTITDDSLVSGYLTGTAATEAQILHGTAEAGSTVTITDADGNAYQTKAQNDGAWSYTLGNVLTDGDQSFAVTATDAAGNNSSSNLLSFTVETVAPAAPTITDSAIIASGGVNYVNAAHDTTSQTLSGKANAGNTVDIYLNGSTTASYTTIADGSGHWSVKIGALANGTYTYSATATDAAGNTATSSDNNLKFTVDTFAPSAPTVTDSAISNGYVTSGQQTLTGTAEAGSTVTITSSDGHTYTAVANGGPAGTTWSYVLQGLSDGNHSYSVTAKDAAGNISSANALSFNVLATAPTAPTITNSAITASGGVNYVNAAHDTVSQTLSGTADAGDTVEVYAKDSHGVSTLVNTTTADGSNNWSIQIGALADGKYTYYAKATNAAGTSTQSAADLSFAVDTAKPTEFLPGGQTDVYNVNSGAISISGVSISDSAGGAVTTVLNVGQGTLNVTGTTGVSGNGTNTLTLTGSQATINGYLKTLKYTTTSTNTVTGNIDDTLKITTTDAAGNSTTGNVSIDVTCFYPGTLIRTPTGEVAVETLKHGDLVLTHDGREVPVAWLGRQTVSTIFSNKNRVLPIRIKAGALAENVPARDLLVSPDHAMLVEGILVQAGALVNDTSIVRETNVPTVFTYYHVEVEDHSLILAECAAAETFVDNVDRMGFDNWDEYEALYPEGKTVKELPYPRAKARRQVPVGIRVALAARAEAIGAVAQADSAVA